MENTQRNSLTICEPLSQPSENSQNLPQTEFSKFTAVPTLNAPQAYQEVHCSNSGRDKIHTDWIHCATRLSLQPHATLESSPGYASSVPNGYLWLITPVVLHQEHSTSFMLANTFLEPPTISACVSQQSTLRLLTALLPPKVLGI